MSVFLLSVKDYTTQGEFEINEFMNNFHKYT